MLSTSVRKVMAKEFMMRSEIEVDETMNMIP
eukprot:CAMPEP_0180791788 /NCGR_PEP_ID=MMETSP1038_2-20121128/54023_1 /TAXON_ID=632150 /ORGANISM="Azadinium spinosum, Strain 3D9" /LENGTH=30 /DNA_ID= /DNA_START= /DNA_END= /DNA_ORIENTATION=